MDDETREFTNIWMMKLENELTLLVSNAGWPGAWGVLVIQT